MSEEERKKRHKMSQRRYALNNPEKVKETSRRYREEHYEEIRARWKSPEYLKKNRDWKKKLNDNTFIECDKEKWHKLWTDDEVDFLISNYQNMSIPEIAKELGRTYIAVERKRNKLGLQKGAENEIIR